MDRLPQVLLFPEVLANRLFRAVQPVLGLPYLLSHHLDQVVLGHQSVLEILVVLEDPGGPEDQVDRPGENM
jgi:hypothetical protein